VGGESVTGGARHRLSPHPSFSNSSDILEGLRPSKMSSTHYESLLQLLSLATAASDGTKFRFSFLLEEYKSHPAVLELLEKCPPPLGINRLMVLFNELERDKAAIKNAEERRKTAVLEERLSVMTAAMDKFATPMDELIKQRNFYEQECQAMARRLRDMEEELRRRDTQAQHQVELIAKTMRDRYDEKKSAATTRITEAHGKLMDAFYKIFDGIPMGDRNPQLWALRDAWNNYADDVRLANELL